MKTNALRFALLILLGLLALQFKPSANAQGTVSFSASSSHGLIQFYNGSSADGPVPVGNPALVGQGGFLGQLNIAVYYAPVGTPVPFNATTAGLLGAPWTESANVLHQIAPDAGFTPSFTFTLSGAVGGSSVEVMVLGWTGNFADWNSALVSAHSVVGWTGSTASGGALAWVNGTGAPNGTPPTSPAVLTYGANGFNGLVIGVPEPASLALTGLGAATLMIARRRR
jgi:hypothetical protein